jgi:hypothetical protein
MRLDNQHSNFRFYGILREFQNCVPSLWMNSANFTQSRRRLLKPLESTIKPVRKEIRYT